LQGKVSIHPESQKDMRTQYGSKNWLLLLGEGGDNYIFLQQLAEVFTTTSKKYISAFKKAHEEHDHEQMKKMIQALKGMCLSMGAIKLSELSLQWEYVLQKASNCLFRRYGATGANLKFKYQHIVSFLS
jgi:HPt (histidine-containing phosphotransfer) domain-containing protein